MSFKGKEEEDVYNGGMSEWMAANFTVAEEKLLTEYRSYKNPKKTQKKRGAEAKFEGGRGREGIQAIQLLRRYDAAQSKISWSKDTVQKKAVQAARLKVRRAELKAQKSRNDMHIHNAISCLEESVPDAGKALSSLRMVVPDKPPTTPLRNIVIDMLHNVEESLEAQREAEATHVLPLASSEAIPPNAKQLNGNAETSLTKRAVHCRLPKEWGFKKLHLVDPPTEDEDGFLTQLQNFSSFLTMTKHYNLWYGFFKVCKKWDARHPQSVRMIDGLRFEFMLSGARGYSAFLQLVMFMNQTGEFSHINEEKFRLDMIAFARRQMLKDVRTENLTVFKDEGLIVSCKGQHRAQNPHIDLLDPLTLQGGLIVTGGKNIQATYEYEAVEPVVTDLATFLSVYRDMPTGLLTVLKATGDSRSGKAAASVLNLLEKVGQLLSKEIIKISTQPEKTSQDFLRTGAMLTLPGQVIHGGPKTEGVRAVLFLVASNKNSQYYNPELQFTTTNTWATLTQHVWEALGDHHTTQESRLYLLGRIQASAIISSGSSATVDQKKLRNFVEEVEMVYGNQPSSGTGRLKTPSARLLKKLETMMVCLSCNFNAMKED